MKNLKVLSILASALAALPGTSYAGELAYPSKDVNLRAGPAIEYPLIARVAAGAEVSVEGCVEGYTWCDVVAGPYRGWVYAGNLTYPYQGSNVPLLGYGAAIGIGILAFSLGSYWDNHYQGRPWYSQRQYWIDRPRPGYGYAPGYRQQPRPGFRPQPGPGVNPGPRVAQPQGPGFRQAAPVPRPQNQGIRQAAPAPQNPGVRQNAPAQAPQAQGVRPRGNPQTQQGNPGQRPQDGKRDK